MTEAEWNQIVEMLREEMGYPDLRRGALEAVNDKPGGTRKMSGPVEHERVKPATPDRTKAQEMAVVVFVATAIVLCIPGLKHAVELMGLAGTLIVALTGSDAVVRKARNARLADENTAVIHMSAPSEDDE